MAERVWDRFLTDQDRAHLAFEAGMRPVPATPAEPRRIDRPVLLLIDLYRWVFGDRPEPLLDAVSRWPGSCGMVAWEALPHLERLLAACRDAGVPVIHAVPSTDLPRRRKSSPRHPSGHDDADPDGAERFRRRYEIVDSLSPVDGELVITKAAPSAFCGTPLLAQLKRLDADTIIVAGESTSGCVRAAVVDARSFQFEVIVPEECVFDRHEAAHAINLFDIHQKYADVVPVDDVLDAIASWWSRARSG